jgi:predicted house-cleaning noncanonical NTP pyrophosphatase (MazG superfamily)
VLVALAAKADGPEPTVECADSVTVAGQAAGGGTRRLNSLIAEIKESSICSVPGMRVGYDKLVRDRIPEIIESGGDRAVTHLLDDGSYHAALLAKLTEEAKEARLAKTEDLPAELADVLEVVQALARTAGMTWEQLLALTADKRAQRGGFDRRIFLEYVEQGE